MHRSLYGQATGVNVELDDLMNNFFQGISRKKDSGVNSEDVIVAMRRQNPYKFVSKDVQNLVHSALGPDGIDVNGFRNFVTRIILESVENYLIEYMEVLQVGNEGSLTRYRLAMLLCQEIGADVSLVKEAFSSSSTALVEPITVESVCSLLGKNLPLMSCLVRHIFRRELCADSGDNVLDRFTSTTVDQLSRKRVRSCCGIL